MSDLQGLIQDSEHSVDQSIGAEQRGNTTGDRTEAPQTQKAEFPLCTTNEVFNGLAQAWPSALSENKPLYFQISNSTWIPCWMKRENRRTTTQPVLRFQVFHTFTQAHPVLTTTYVMTQILHSILLKKRSNCVGKSSAFLITPLQSNVRQYDSYTCSPGESHCKNLWASDVCQEEVCTVCFITVHI